MQKWEYFTAFCYWHQDCKVCKKDALGKRQSHWVLDINDGGHHYIQNGLNILGDQGWELAAAQKAYEATVPVDERHPAHWYLFKRPKSG